MRENENVNSGPEDDQDGHGGVTVEDHEQEIEMWVTTAAARSVTLIYTPLSPDTDPTARSRVVLNSRVWTG